MTDFFLIEQLAAQDGYLLQNKSMFKLHKTLA